MTTEPPAVAGLSRPRQQSPLAGPASQDPSEPVEFRGFEFFSNREYNQYKDASRAYFGAAEKNEAPSSWLGDATPPHRSLEEPRSVNGGFSQNDSDSDKSDDRKILGLRRPWFWAVLTLVIVLVLVIIGVGAGVGTAQHASSMSSNPNAGDGATSTSMSTASTSAPTTTTTTASSKITNEVPRPTNSPEPAGGVVTGCPGANGTTYQVPGTTKSFSRLCGVDYGKEDGAVDMENIPTLSVTECINSCAGTEGCTGCGWGFIQGDRGPQHRCWLKSDLTKSHAADESWAFALLL
ncbi:hypothetical protein F5Y17DRAFT_28839 [Xylariaceae sp. FL0594]|nr:hypothetical protein F5Y17DRAFT_28839 [Xylariaceae sp. FL0594]